MGWGGLRFQTVIRIAAAVCRQRQTVACWLVLSLLSVRPLGAMESESPAVMPAAPSVEALLIEGSAPPLIDGDISDAIWSRAQRVELSYQFEPQALVKPTERTEAWILYDRNRLYVAFHAYDSQPQNVSVTTMARDAPLRNDDAVRVLLDPRHTRREGYLFSLNPGGSRMDALIPADRQQDAVQKWNMLWRGKSRRVADGWTAEFEIPFRGLQYDSADSSWAFDLVRNLRRNGESMRWAAVPQGSRAIELGYAGELTGLQGLSQGRGLDVQLYGMATATRDWIAGDTTVKGKPSGTLYYKFTPLLTGLVTANTDFSDKPLDTRQVNTTRFSLFEPETREFFLEDADAFEFGSFGTGSAANGRPFFSRNIGLVRGRVVNLDVGAKLSGDIGSVRVGALTVRTGANEQIPAQTLSVVRMSTDVLDESRIGAIFTSGDPTGLSRNEVAGVDFRYRRSDFLPGKRLDAVLFAERSFSNVYSDDNAYGFTVDYPNEPWQATLRAYQIGEDFRPALGFVNRPGVRLYEGELASIRRLRNSVMRSVDVRAFEQRYTGLDNRLQSRNDRLSTLIETRTNGEISAGIDNYVEVLSEPFPLAGTLIVPAGRHEYLRGYAGFVTSTTRPLSLSLKVTCCEFFDGHSTEVETGLGYRPGPRFNLEFKHKLQPIHLPSGTTSIHIESLNTTLNFSPDMRLVSELQYDNVSNRFSGSLRYLWDIRPATELLVAISESSLLTGMVPHGSYQSQGTVFSLRLGHRLQL